MTWGMVCDIRDACIAHGVELPLHVSIILYAATEKT